jgi:ABC-type transport system involved in multi-copper enzyme maturation permease subunit
MGVTALASYAVVTIDSSSSTWPSWEITLKAFGALVLQLAVWASLGALLGIAFRSAAAAIGGGLVYLFVVEALLGSLFRTTPVVKEILKFLPGVNGGAINASFPATFRDSSATALVGAGRGVVTLLLYLAIFTISSVLIFRERDVGGS